MIGSRQKNNNAKFYFLGTIWENESSWRAYFQALTEPKIQNF